MTDYNYYAGCEVRCASGAGTTRLATSTGSRRHCSRSRRRRLTTRSAAGVTHALPLTPIHRKDECRGVLKG